MAMMRTRTKSRGMCLCLLGIALALLVQPSTDFARGVPGLKDSMLAKRHPLHAGVARRAGAAQEDNSAEAGDTLFFHEGCQPCKNQQCPPPCEVRNALEVYWQTLTF
ncbi:unnamed protein product [Effrenium voratum]|uniref:Uncharacterized protein n=1 Tax=Effrenium voratum TaxID=2562239 RepID=A0AA36INI6_9DINO|nr:unnamed protein product [Effrenium voratum]CAJ1412776.1 unnamed protein product [Effrenium voratum]